MATVAMSVGVAPNVPCINKRAAAVLPTAFAATCVPTIDIVWAATAPSTAEPVGAAMAMEKVRTPLNAEPFETGMEIDFAPVSPLAQLTVPLTVRVIRARDRRAVQR
ncbi:MAG: hypothetical protein WDO56_21665 [Gammaproteobacteria bacterium]